MRKYTVEITFKEDDSKLIILCDKYLINYKGEFINTYYDVIGGQKLRTIPFNLLRHIHIHNNELMKIEEDFNLWPLHFTRTINQ